jgi:translation initiation factor IF-2
VTDTKTLREIFKNAFKYAQRQDARDDAVQAGIDVVAARVRAETIDEITSWIEPKAEKAPDDATRTAFETIAFCIGDMQ